MWVSSVTVGAPDPGVLAEFYARFLGWEVTAKDGPPPGGAPPEIGWAQVQAPEGTPGLRTINVELERDYVPPVCPSVAGEQQIQTHLDIPVEDVDEAAARAVEAGARLAEVQPREYNRVMLDPAGHPFCLFPGG
ncbi:VOC family protein [Kribbella sp. CA-247076]|uniref:VOC family protein n=1 Tax=Kribbella sp. CA-247076 TaxID=3239941 RepID=UPI003D8EEC41